MKKKESCSKRKTAAGNNIENNRGRRDFLKLSGAGAALLAGIGIESGLAEGVSEGGPMTPEDWTLTFEDTFDGGSLDTSKWSIGFGWGRETNGSPERIVDENVTIESGILSLKGTHDGSDYKSGSVNSKGKAYFGPGSYWEAKIKMPKRVGFLPAFWSKPNDESWPPEIDFVELFQTSGSWSDTAQSHHNIHYSSSTQKGDSGTHTTYNSSYDSGVDLTNRFHIYGCEWFEDRVVHYLDGEEVAVCTDGTILEALNNGAPFYMMLNIHIDRVGTADPSESWGEAMEVDWVRVWEYSGSSDPTGGTDTPQSSETHYLWVRSADSDPATYEFTASAGNIRIDENERSGGESDEYVSGDGTTAGGSVVSGDGFWFDGEITDFSYTGSIETYIDNQYVEPDSIVDKETTSKPTEEPPADHYLWVRSSGGESVPYAFSTSHGNIRIDENERSGDESDEWVAEDGMIAGGTVSNGDGFWYTGDITDFNHNGSIETYVDNQYVDPDSLVDPDSSGPELRTTEPILPRTVTINGGSQRSDYRFSVTEALQPTRSINSSDQINGTDAEGLVRGGSDTYRFAGELSSLTVDGDATVSVDGESVKKIVISKRSNSTGSVSYLVETSGRLVPTAKMDGSDRVSGGKSLGTVDGDSDTYWLQDGSVHDVSTFGGEVDTLIDGRPMDFIDS